MSHEIRTPMNAVVGLTHLLGLSTLDATQADLLEKLRTAGKSLLRVIDDLLDLSTDAGELTLEHATFVLTDVLTELNALTSTPANAKGLRFSIDTPADLPVAFNGDARCIRRVLTHLLMNAVKFTHEGSITLSVTRLVRSEETLPTAERVERLLFTVSDSGIGIAPEDEAHVLAPFMQVDGSSRGRSGGSGLGLSIVERLVASMGGSVGFRSRPGIGSSFWFELTLPVATAPLPRVAAATPECLDLQGMRILIVDDSEINLEVASRILKGHGAHSTLVRDGLQAVDLLQQRPEDFDAVLMDIQMPVLDGREATRRIRTRLGLVQLPIIALSAGGLPHERESARISGMNGFIRKPFDAQDLVRTLLHHVLPCAEPLAAGALPVAAAPGTNKDWPELVGIDTASVRMRLGGDLDLFGAMLKRMLTEFAGVGQELSAAGTAQGASLAALAARMHKLKGSAGTLGASAIARLAEWAEAACRNNQPAQARDMGQALAARLQALGDHWADLLERVHRNGWRDSRAASAVDIPDGVSADENEARKIGGTGPQPLMYIE